MIAGMAAGFGGLFQTPFAAVFFAMEVVVSGSMAYSALLPAAIASFTASATSHALGLEKFSVLLSQTLSLTDTKTVTYLIFFGILFGLTGRLFAVLLQKVKQFMAIYQTSSPSYILMASIDACVDKMQKDGQQMFREFTFQLEKARQRLLSLIHI